MTQRRIEKKGPRHRAGKHGEKRSGNASRETAASDRAAGVSGWVQAGDVINLPNIRARAAALLSEVLGSRRNLKAALQTEQAKLDREDDRALLRELVAGVVRKLPHLDWIVEKKMSRGIADTEDHLLNILRVGAYQVAYLHRIPAYAAVHECVEAAKAYRSGAGGFVNGILRAVSEDMERLRAQLDAAIAEAPLDFKSCFPDWMASRYLARFGDAEAERLLASLQVPPDVCIYFPTRELEKMGIESLEREGIAVNPDGVFERTYSITSGDIFRTVALRDGLFYIMDPGSQVPAHLLPIEGCRAALDLCSAPGGKAVILSSRAPACIVVGADSSRKRLALAASNTRRMGIQNVKLVQADLEMGLPFQETFGSVLLDAPCTSLGTLRRNPEIRWQIGEKDILRKSDRQKSLIETAASAVAPGGHLLYSVCSFEEEETLEVTEHFLSKRRDFSLAELDPPDRVAEFLAYSGKGQAFLLPHRYRWDGFYIALFKRS